VGKIFRDRKFFHHNLGTARENEGNNVADAQCSCGFIETEGTDETIGDHLFEAFAPDDGKGPDGKVRLEGRMALHCLCGAGGSAPELDAHWLELFTPADSVGRDGVRHERSERFRRSG
jgi:hypothetical protein